MSPLRLPAPPEALKTRLLTVGPVPPEWGGRLRGGVTRFIESTRVGADLTEPMTGEDVIGLDRQDVAQMADRQVRLTDPEE